MIVQFIYSITVLILIYFNFILYLFVCNLSFNLLQNSYLLEILFFYIIKFHHILALLQKLIMNLVFNLKLSYI